MDMNTPIRNDNTVIECPAGKDCLGKGRHYANNYSAITECLRHKANKERMHRNSQYIESPTYRPKDNPEANANKFDTIIQEYKDDPAKAAENINALIQSNNANPIRIETDFGTVAVAAAEHAPQNYHGKNIDHIIYQVDPKESADCFHNGQTYCYHETAYGKQVTIDDHEDIQKVQTAYITSDGQAGGYVKEDGEFGGLFSTKKSQHRVSNAILDVVMEHDGDRVSHLECFDTFLPKIYQRNNFQAVAHIPFDDKYAPEGWDYQAMEKYNNGRPPVLIMMYREHMKNPINEPYNYNNETSYDGDNIKNIIQHVKGQKE